MRIGLEIVEFLAVGIANVPPVAVDGGEFAGLQVGQKDGAILGPGRLGQRSGQGGAFECLMRLGQLAQLGEGRVNINQAHGSVGTLPFRHTGAGPDKWYIGGAFPKCVFAPVTFLAMMIAVIAPEYHEGVVGIRAGVQCIQHAADHGVGVADAGEVSVDGVVHGLQ